jgi:transglutaminase-like putative cysteine protease
MEPFYVVPATMTSAGRYASLFDPLPRDVAALAAVAQGLLIHEHIAQAYGVTLTDEDRATVHIRPAEQLLERIIARDDRPLATGRAVADRVAGNCRHFTVLMVAMLRAQGTPARARCGFGAYFVDGLFEDHWVCEYWHAGQERWMLVDAQIDEKQRGMFRIDFDLTDVPRDRFLVAGDAWARCRAGAADPRAFGLSTLNEAGYWWIAGNLMRDVAALDNIELLPWDCWGAMPKPEEQIDDDRNALYDRLAALTHDPEADFAELRRLCREDDRVRVPSAVYNELRDRAEPI